MCTLFFSSVLEMVLIYVCLQGSTKSLTYSKQRSTLPRSFSVDRVMERVMERHYDFDLTYITERIISVFFPPLLEDQRYRINLKEVTAMLKSKHQDKFLLFNLSERRHDITRMNPKVHDFGWPDLHAPPLDKICAMCKAMETWLTSDPQHVVVLHCKGNKGKTGVIIAAYMHYSKISAGRADQALSTLAMRKFCEDKVSSSLQPSQNRYIYYFGGLLSGSIKMNSSPLFLHQVLIPTLPNFQGYFPFLKIYQSMQLRPVPPHLRLTVPPGSGPSRPLCRPLQVKCYHRRAQGAERDTVFRLQFHTCTIHGAQLWFGKGELDEACTDERFPSDATVEFVFSSGPEKIKGREYQRNDPAVTVDYNTADPVVRWDSYENFNQRYQDSLEGTELKAHTRGPVDGSLYAQIKKRRSGPGSGSLTSTNGSPAGSSEERPSQHQLLSPSSDSLTHSGLSCAFPDRPEEPRGPPPPTQQEREELDRLLGGIEGERDGRGRERETAILDDGDSSSTSDRAGTLRLGRSCSCRAGYRSQRCAEPGCDRLHLLPNGYCLDRAPGSNGHHGAPPSASPAIGPSHMDLCQHYSPHPHQAPPPPDLVWDHAERGTIQNGLISCVVFPGDHFVKSRFLPRGMCESVGWRDHISQGSFKRMHREAHAPCSTPSDLSGPPTPVHTSSPLRAQGRYVALSSSSRHASHALRVELIDAVRVLSLASVCSSAGLTGQDYDVPSTDIANSDCESTRSQDRPDGAAAQGHRLDAQLLPGPPQPSSVPHTPPPTQTNHLQIAQTQGSPSRQQNQGVATPPSQPRDHAGGHSPVPEGQATPTFPTSAYAQSVPYSGYTAVTIPQPPLPEKRRPSAQPGSPNGGVGTLRPSPAQHHVTFSPTVGEMSTHTGQGEEVSVKFVQDSSRFWYKPGISRDQAIAALKEKEPGAFLIRDSNSFQGAYGLALKVATPPANVNNHTGDPLEQLVRHFLIETGPRGVKIKGCQNEPHFGSLSALVYQHSITPISLPCALHIPEKDPIGEMQEQQSAASNMSTAADLLKQGAACNVLYLNSVETESLTGPQAISKAAGATLGKNLRPAATVVHFKVSSQGITLTDSQRRVFFRRHYPVSSVTFSSIDPKDRRWTNSDSTTSKVFGFVAKKPGSTAENVCHLFAELDPEQPASAIVNFINKVMLAPQRR
uniref:Tensin 2a n=1 Tax=Esox lucius TaxID=8010 RepID=A0A3P8Y873_ESOLU